MLIPVISTSTDEPGALGTGLWFGHSHRCCHRAHSKLGCSIKPAPSPQQPCGSGWGLGSWMALKEMGSYGRLLEKHVWCEGEPLSPLLQVKMGKQRWQQTGGDASPCQAAVSVLAAEGVSPGHKSHFLRMDVLSPPREGGLPEAARVTAWELGAHSPPLAEAQHQLSHSPVQVGMGNVSSTQGSPRGLGYPAGLTWRSGRSSETAPPATLAGMAAEAPWPPPPAPKASLGPSLWSQSVPPRTPPHLL